MQIALVTYNGFEELRSHADCGGDKYKENIVTEDKLLMEALAARHGIRDVCRVSWSNASFDWTKPTLVVIRTPWDYYLRPREFFAWLDKIEPLGVRLINGFDVLRWNGDKHYFRDLEECGVRCVPTVYIEKGDDARTLASVLEEQGWEEAVLKPCISGAARETYRFRRGAECEALEPTLRRLVAGEAMMVQEFMRYVVDTGEVTVVAFGGRISHAIRKIAKDGDFRVQDDFGGRVVNHEATAAEKALTERAFAVPQLKGKALYGRLDIVQDAAGNLLVMEVEVIEPELWLRFSDDAPAAFADELAAALKKAEAK